MPKSHRPPAQLVAIVVTCNRLEQLKITMARLLATAPEALDHLLVVDNASTDGTSDFLEAYNDPRLTVHTCERNIGGAGGFETGMRLASEKFDPDWMVLMDDDARPYKGALEAFHAQPRDGAHAWGAAVYHTDGPICDMNRPSLNPFWRKDVLWNTLSGKGRNGFHLGEREYEGREQLKIDGTSFVGFFISREGIAKVGYPDGSLFLYGDDALYTLTLTKLGGEIRFAPEVKFEHAFTTMKGDDQRFRPLWKTYYHYRNLLMVYRMASGPFFIFVLPAATLKWLLKVRFHGGERRAFLRYVLHAVKDGIMRKTDVSHEDVVRMGEEYRI